jgi:hypothetical protein
LIHPPSSALSKGGNWKHGLSHLSTRRIIGFAVAPADIDGASVCRMFNHATAGQPLAKYLSLGNDPLPGFHRWGANLRILELEQVMTVPSVTCEFATPTLFDENTGAGLPIRLAERDPLPQWCWSAPAYSSPRRWPARI